MTQDVCANVYKNVTETFTNVYFKLQNIASFRGPSPSDALTRDFAAGIAPRSQHIGYRAGHGAGHGSLVPAPVTQILDPHLHVGEHLGGWHNWVLQTLLHQMISMRATCTTNTFCSWRQWSILKWLYNMLLAAYYILFKMLQWVRLDML